MDSAMSSARAIVYPGKFTNPNLPVVPLEKVAPTPGALYSWSADSLPLGDIGGWKDIISGAEMVADGGMPVVTMDNGGPAVTLSGTDNGPRLRVLTPGISGPHTVLAVYRLTTLPNRGDTIVIDYKNGGSGGISIHTQDEQQITALTLNVGQPAEFLIPNPPIPPTVTWAVGLLHIDGNSSSLRINGREALGKLTAQTREGLTLGYSSHATKNRTAIAYKRIELIPGKMGPSDRASAVQRLMKQYGIH